MCLPFTLLPLIKKSQGTESTGHSGSHGSRTRYLNRDMAMGYSVDCPGERASSSLRLYRLGHSPGKCTKRRGGPLMITMDKNSLMGLQPCDW